MKIKIIKKDGLKDSHYLKKFYSYLKEKEIEIVHKTEECDLIVTFGGDGTILGAAQEIFKQANP